MDNVLEDERRTLLLGNPRHLKTVPGRKTDVTDSDKTDVTDSEWLADLLRPGPLTARFLPPQPIRALRDLTRYPTDLYMKG